MILLILESISILRLISYISFRIVSSEFFIKMIFLFIFLDSSILIWNPPQEQTQTFEFVVANLYLLEMILKMIAFGLFFKPNSYFRNKWNFLDFGVVVSIYFYSFFNIFVSFGLSFLRNLIVLRLIKLPAFQLILDKLFYSCVILFDTFLIIMILLFICSLVGVQLFLGLLKYRCMNSFSGFYGDSTVCGSHICPVDYLCVKTLDNPDSGVTNYDNIFYGLLQTLRLITLDNWSDLQGSLQNAFSEYVWIYSIIIVILGNFFLINLMLSVLKVKYSECNPDTLNEIQAYLERYKEKSYKLHELKAQGYYTKNKTTGIRTLGVQKKNSFLNLLSGNRKSIAKLTSKITPPPSKKVNFANILNPQSFLRMTKKTFGFLNKQKIHAMFRKTRLLSLKEGAANLGKKTIEIRIDHNIQYEFESINDVLPLK